MSYTEQYKMYYCIPVMYQYSYKSIVKASLQMILEN